MKLELLPDIAALGALLFVLALLRRKHPEERVGLWLGGLVLIFVEGIAHFFYLVPGPWHPFTHALALDCYALAGAVFLWSAYQPLYSTRHLRLYTFANTPPLLALLTLYGLGIHDHRAFYAVTALGLIAGLAVVAYLRLGAMFLLSRATIAVLIGASIFHGDLRQAAYLGLFYLFLLVAIGFTRSLPHPSIGRITIITGFSIWAFIFATHSLVLHFPPLETVADEIWDLQAFIVTIGMLLVLLERQVAGNQRLALHDQLTGLPNRRLFDDRLNQEFLRASRDGYRFALFILDLDGFKFINDSLGHDVGDEFLREVACNLRKSLRSYHTLARIGGDEFAIISPDLPSGTDGSEAIARQMREVLERPITVGGYTFTISGSIGCSIFPDDTADPLLLRRIADLRMYEQKRANSSLAPSPKPSRTFAGETAASNMP